MPFSLVCIVCSFICCWLFAFSVMLMHVRCAPQQHMWDQGQLWERAGYRQSQRAPPGPMVPPRAVSHISMMPQHTAQQTHGQGPHSAPQYAARHMQGSMLLADVDSREMAEGAEDAWVSDSRAAHAQVHEMRQDRQQGPFEELEPYQQAHGRRPPAHTQQPWGTGLSHSSAPGTADSHRRRRDGPAIADWNEELVLGYPPDAPSDPGTYQKHALWQEQPVRHIYQVSATGQPHTQYPMPSQLQADGRQQAGATVMHAGAMHGTRYTAAAAAGAMGQYHEHPPGQLPIPLPQ